MRRTGTCLPTGVPACAEGDQGAAGGQRVCGQPRQRGQEPRVRESQAAQHMTTAGTRTATRGGTDKQPAGGHHALPISTATSKHRTREQWSRKKALFIHSMLDSFPFRCASTLTESCRGGRRRAGGKDGWMGGHLGRQIRSPTKACRCMPLLRVKQHRPPPDSIRGCGWTDGVRWGKGRWIWRALEPVTEIYYAAHVTTGAAERCTAKGLDFVRQPRCRWS